ERIAHLLSPRLWRPWWIPPGWPAPTIYPARALRARMLPEPIRIRHMRDTYGCARPSSSPLLRARRCSGLAVAPGSGTQRGQPLGGGGDPLVGGGQRHPDVASPRGPVELARGDQDAGPGGQPLGRRPAVVRGVGDPQVQPG